MLCSVTKTGADQQVTRCAAVLVGWCCMSTRKSMTEPGSNARRSNTLVLVGVVPSTACCMPIDQSGVGDGDAA